MRRYTYLSASPPPAPAPAPSSSSQIRNPGRPANRARHVRRKPRVDTEGMEHVSAKGHDLDDVVLPKLDETNGAIHDPVRRGSTVRAHRKRPYDRGVEALGGIGGGGRGARRRRGAVGTAEVEAEEEDGEEGGGEDEDEEDHRRVHRHQVSWRWRRRRVSADEGRIVVQNE
ncbi:hypothetical protein TorRG33x02_254880 [Trema orientale]|uniref:Uncharacterized protein n=1 Tax=Trema orientale TaxID=63057 RepID=A0A2P5DD19_TREOI|nr:hypothetical protein TorRG33x02_254880 [Trema orientale]